jgi:hypothetical protein
MPRATFRTPALTCQDRLTKNEPPGGGEGRDEAKRRPVGAAMAASMQVLAGDVQKARAGLSIRQSGRAASEDATFRAECQGSWRWPRNQGYTTEIGLLASREQP